MMQITGSRSLRKTWEPWETVVSLYKAQEYVVPGDPGND
jgi:hypothetical protein